AETPASGTTRTRSCRRGSWDWTWIFPTHTVTGRNFELIPFGGGRRICPGLPLAMRMLNLMLGSLLNCFDNWSLEDGVAPETMNMEDKFGLTFGKAQPLMDVPMT
ncbi:unnamed protein product, partial [Prunus brigantina]